MKHIEKHTFQIEFDHNLVIAKASYLALYEEMKLFSKAWPSAEVNITYGMISISYTGYQSYVLAHDSAHQFKETVK